MRPAFAPGEALDTTGLPHWRAAQVRRPKLEPGRWSAGVLPHSTARVRARVAQAPSGVGRSSARRDATQVKHGNAVVRRCSQWHGRSNRRPGSYRRWDRRARKRGRLLQARASPTAQAGAPRPNRRLGQKRADRPALCMRRETRKRRTGRPDRMWTPRTRPQSPSGGHAFVGSSGNAIAIVSPPVVPETTAATCPPESTGPPEPPLGT